VKKLLVILTLLSGFLVGCSSGGGGGGSSTHPVNNTTDTTAPVLSDVNQSYTTTVGTALSLQNVTATDNVDTSVSVVQTGSVDFDTAGTYNVVYTATDSASNSSSVTHTYTVNEVPNSAPTVTDENLSVALMEYTTSVTNLLANVSDSDGDTLSIASVTMLDGSSSLPTGYSVADGNLTINATSIDVADSANLEYDLNVTITDGEDNVSYIVNSTIQDTANDSLLTFTTSIPSTVDSNATLVGSVTLVDSDGLSNTNITYTVQDLNDNNNTVYTSEIVDSNNNGTYDFSIDISAESIAVGNYVFVAVVSPVIGGENAQSDVTITSNFQVVSTPVIDVIPTQNVDDNGGFVATSLLTVSGTDINVGAVYSIVNDPTSGGLTINSNTGEIVWDRDIGINQTYSITVKVENTDGGIDTETFTLNVTNNA